jgi:predicted ATPase
LALPRRLPLPPAKLGCLIYRLIKEGQGYQEADVRTYELRYKDQILRSLRKRANGFGFELVEVPKAA